MTLSRLWYCDQHPIPLPPGHKFPISKYRMLRDRLAQDKRFVFEPAPFAVAASVELIHDREYVRRFLQGELDPRTIRRIGFPWSEDLVRRTMASVGGTLCAAEDALQFGWGGTLAGGTHHAFPSEGAGFCVFNDIAVTIRALQSRGLVRRAAVVDLDVHQGDGTAAIFRDDTEVLTLSIHGAHNFPFRKQESKIDFPLPDGTEDEEYLAALSSVLPRVFEFRPDLVIYQSGVDGLAADKLGRLKLTHAGLAARDRIVFEGCRANRVPCAVTLGGGYSDPIDLTVQAHANTFLAAAEIIRNKEDC